MKSYSSTLRPPQVSDLQKSRLVKPRQGPTLDCQARAGKGKAKGQAAQQGSPLCWTAWRGCARDGQRVFIEAPGHHLDEEPQGHSYEKWNDVSIGTKTPQQRQQFPLTEASMCQALC